jgi:hypothetical protein
MSKFVGSVVAVLVVFALTIEEGNALKCWRCSSDSSTSAFCNDPFDPTLIQNDQQRRWAFVDCNVPTVPFNVNASPQKAVCKKIKTLVNDRPVVSRSCVFEDISTPPNYCSPESLISYAKIEFCETCSHDGCNSAGTFVPAALLTFASLLIARFLAF